MIRMLFRVTEPLYTDDKFQDGSLRDVWSCNLLETDQQQRQTAVRFPIRSYI
jgi:hypothetical protein